MASTRLPESVLLPDSSSPVAIRYDRFTSALAVTFGGLKRPRPQITRTSDEDDFFIMRRTTG